MDRPATAAMPARPHAIREFYAAFQDAEKQTELVELRVSGSEAVLLRAPILSRALATAGWSMRLLFICRLACDADHSTQSLVGRRGGARGLPPRD
jgi:hypothetical protein